MMPDIFASIIKNQDLAANASTICDILGKNVRNATENDSDHFVAVDGQVYVNSIIIGVATAVGALGAAYLIDILGKNALLGMILFESYMKYEVKL